MQSTVTNANKRKFLIGGLVIAAAIIALIISATNSSMQYYMTVNELSERASEMQGKEIRISGAVLGDSIQVEGEYVYFTIAHVTGDLEELEAAGGLAEVLHEAANDPNAKKLAVIYKGVRPDLLKNEAQAILTGTLDENGIFRANELLLKCPSRYEAGIPTQTVN